MKKLMFVMLAIVMAVSAITGCAAPAANPPAAATDGGTDAQVVTTVPPSSDDEEAPASVPEEESGSSLAEPLKVRVGVTPYAMYQQFELAKQRGIDKQFGLDLEVQQYTSTSVGFENLLRGDVDVTCGCPADHVAIMENSPDIVNFQPVGIFIGFFYVANSADTKAWSDLVAEMGEEKAKETQIKAMKGKTFCIIPQRKPWIISTISQYGMTEDDVNIMFFADDQKAATAFMSGQGDYYMGSLPQQTAVLKSDPEKYVNAGGQEIMGEAGLWYDTMLTTNKFFDEKPEEAVRLYALMCGMVNLFDKDNEAFAKDAVEIFKSIGSTFTVEEYIEFQTVFDDFMSLDEAKNTFYNPDSLMYWKPAVDFQIDLAREDGTLVREVKSEDYYMQGENVFKGLLQRQDLLDVIESFK